MICEVFLSRWSLRIRLQVTASGDRMAAGRMDECEHQVINYSMRLLEFKILLNIC